MRTFLAALPIAAWRQGVFLVWASIIGIPLYGPLMPRLEGTVLPVTSQLEIVAPAPDGHGALTFRFSYSKYKDCELLGTEARSNGHNVEFAPVDGTKPVTRLSGNQLSRLWRLNADTLDGVEIFFVHRCGLLWLTITKVFG